MSDPTERLHPDDAQRPAPDTANGNSISIDDVVVTSGAEPQTTDDERD